MNEIQFGYFITYVLLVLILAFIMLGVSFLIGERRVTTTKTQQPYESGILPTHSAEIRIPVQFYLIAMFFVIFDLELVFIFAWATVVREAGWLGFGEMALFMGILLVALVYLWRTGALDWGPRWSHIKARMEASHHKTSPLSRESSR